MMGPFSGGIAAALAAFGALVPAALAHAAGPALASSSLRARVPAAPAEVWRLMLVNGNLLALYQIVSGQNQCFVYTYDHNGNRLTRSNLNPPATPTWGSSVYGCYNWTTP